MGESRLRPLTGEFRDERSEAAFRADRFGDAQRHVRLVLVACVLITALFMLLDQQSSSAVANPRVFWLRALIVVSAIAAFLVVGRVRQVATFERVLLVWQWLLAACVALLVLGISGAPLALSAFLPVSYYLVMPVATRWRFINGLGSSLMLVLAYSSVDADRDRLLVLLLWGAVMNAALVVIVIRDNRLSRLSWSARQAEREALAAALRSSDLLQKTFLAAPIPLLISDLETGTIIRYNDAGVRYFGGTPDEFEITTTRQIYVHPDGRQQFRELIRKQGTVTGFETTIRLGKGEERTVLLEGTAVNLDGRACVISGVVDITDRLVAEQKARHAALHDVLTGLPNRAAFQEELEKACATGGSVCLLLMDLDSLKDVNDTFGHDVGDALLRESGQRLGALVAGRWIVARLGGDEFVVLLTGVDQVRAHALAQDIVADFRRPMFHGTRPLFTKASVGIAMRPDGTQPPGELMKDADLALYAAKQQGRNRAVVYSPAMRQAMKERVSLHRALTDAAAAEAIVPFYQPKISLITGRIVGFEALMRWRQGPQAFLAPGAFDQAFQDPDLAVLIGDSMVRQVSADVRNWHGAGLDFGRMALNLSPAQFTHLDLGNHLLARFAEAKVAPELFEVEVTETVFLGRRVEHVAPILRQFYDAGIRIALDDFGTGYAALTHLKQLPIDTIKIDQSFVEDIESDTFDAAIVNSVLELGHTLGMQVVAEGVETMGQARFLAGKGCEVVQGFLYARPMPAAHARDLIVRESEAVAAVRLRDLKAST
ncbi:hypothetical protein GCM10007301_46340 [Azorhizobium oxalatiphilum]|uniref:EAL domain-containing protein n=1 Tax=Azorhizobium oxalatiphilum TaxID=980631 RepID=A0A917FIJ4_9HYPH|nr:GGDEF and EAL domain-containing protein [Azorhizobium oxalatiphilum]GGF80968.1 hypothetical protein GCM10007301_46340 [Azorhizobium oxalatiphilum]